MPIISQNLGSPVQFRGDKQTNAVQKPQSKTVQKAAPEEYWRAQKRKNSGLIERLYNAIKNLTGLGTGSKRVEKELAQVKAGKLSEDEFTKTVDKYSSSQEMSAQLLGDGASIAAAGGTFFGLNKIFKYASGGMQINQTIVDKAFNEIKNLIKEGTKDGVKNSTAKNNEILLKILEKTRSFLMSNKKQMAVLAGAAALAGGTAKLLVSWVNRIGSKEYSLDKSVYGDSKTRTPLQRTNAKADKKKMTKAWFGRDFRDFTSGAINGLMMPVMALGGWIGAPVYLLGNSINRYLVANRTDKHKSVKGYVDNMANDGVTVGLAAAAAAVPLVIKGNHTKAFNENMKKVIDALKDANLKDPEYKGLSAYKELETELLGNSEIKAIINATEGQSLEIVQQQAQKLIDTNLFAAKMKQISNDGTQLFHVLKEDCPPTRTLEEVQAYVNKNLGDGYKLKNLLGVGTVAETYFAQDPQGKEVCIKVLKNGISKEKILADKEKFIEIVKNMKGKSQEEIDYLVRNVEDLAQGILKEVDLKNEMEAAQKLEPVTKLANMVKPIKVQNNVYVMERAKGVSLESFMKLNDLYLSKDAVEKLGRDSAKDRIAYIEKEIAKVKSRMPGFEDVKFDKKDTNYILEQYQKVFVEQFHKINKDGKIIHGDLHPGNIFIDPEVLKTRKGNLFTLIDTGNTIEMTAEQSLRALNFTKYIKQGNVKDIAAFVLDGAKLPKGMTQEQAMEKMTAELKKCFFDKETKIGTLNDEKVLTLTDNIMQKLNIIPNSTQLNLNKSRTSARNSYAALQEALLALDINEIAASFNNGGKVKGSVKAGQKGLEALYRNKKCDAMIKAQENKNLRQLPFIEQWRQMFNPNAPKTSSEDYITYKLKQYKLELKDNALDSLGNF